MSVIIYSEHIEILEEENLLLRKEVVFLRKQLGYKSLGNLETLEDEEDQTII
tara:strand:+ start:84 stop:239 length:156 start_codon:yes stop_codon:yes gene_type:complete